MKSKLSAARWSSLPTAKGGDGDDEEAESTLFVHVDGYNLMGCDSECRSAMRSKSRKRAGMKAARRRLARLLQHEFVEKAGALGLGYNVRTTLWFDGKGHDEKYGDVEIAFSSKEQIVDDKLVEMLGRESVKAAGTLLVVTSDRKLTVRLHDVGVLVMKSGVFYKRYLRPKGADKKDVDDHNHDDHDHDDEDQVTPPEMANEQQQEEEAMSMVMTDDFVAVINGKVECGRNDEDEADTQSGDSGGVEMDSDDAPDEMEGGGPRDETAEDGEDSDYLEIYGDDDEEEEDEEEMVMEMETEE